MTINVEEAAAGIAADLFGSSEPEEKVDAPEETPEISEVADPTETAEASDPASLEKPVVTAPVVRAPPKSWAKETHELWTKIDPKAQEYVELREKQMLDGIEQYKEHFAFGKTMKDVITPYKALIASQGIDEAKAVGVLMNAHYKMSSLPPAERASYFAMLAKNYGVDLGQIRQPQQQEDETPAIRALREKFERREQADAERDRQQAARVRQSTEADVIAFAEAKDEKGQALHPYFDEVGDDIVTFINAGLSLPDAYAKAIRANPVTYEKEVARLRTETETQLREKAKREAEAARKASSTNVRSRDTGRSPTEPLGKMEDTMRATLAAIKSRTH